MLQKHEYPLILTQHYKLKLILVARINEERLHNSTVLKRLYSFAYKVSKTSIWKKCTLSWKYTFSIKESCFSGILRLKNRTTFNFKQQINYILVQLWTYAYQEQVKPFSDNTLICLDEESIQLIKNTRNEVLIKIK